MNWTHFVISNPATQRSTGDAEIITLTPVSEAPLDPESVSLFRSQYRTLFQSTGEDDPLYEAVSEGRRHQGLEHWLPLFHANLASILDYMPDAKVFFDHRAEEALKARRDLIAEYYTARQTISDVDSGVPYRPVPPNQMYVTEDEFSKALHRRSIIDVSPFDVPDLSAEGRVGREYAEVRVDPKQNVYEAVSKDIEALTKKSQRVVVATLSDGSRERLKGLLIEHGAPSLMAIEADTVKSGDAAVGVIELDRGFIYRDLTVITETDILGERLARPGRRRIRPENFIAEASSLAPGDLVVHVEHGIGRFDDLETIEVGGAPHDCLRLVYAGDAKLFLPVENVDLLTRYGSEDAGVQLDRLGSAAWQARRAKMKARVREMADELIKIAAARELKAAPKFAAPEGAYEEFLRPFSIYRDR